MSQNKIKNSLIKLNQAITQVGYGKEIDLSGPALSKRLARPAKKEEVNAFREYLQRFADLVNEEIKGLR